MDPRWIGYAAWVLVSGIRRTMRVEVREDDPRYGLSAIEPAIYVMWHGRMFIPMTLMGGKDITLLVSEHRDGEIITATLAAAGYPVVRGSTTRGGARALARMVRITRNGGRVAITSDGPRGPRWQMQAGAIYLAAKSGLPLVPLAASAASAKYFSSWDSFQLPRPFTRGLAWFGKPYHVPGDVRADGIEYHRAEMERRFNELIRATDEAVGATQP
jgi:lysophospholipid acyltransferase (LPLAT)-like uncharacterized protein